MERTCNKCHETKPLAAFQKHNAGWRHVCRDCRALQNMKWQMELTGKELERFERNRNESTRRYLDRMKAKRAAAHAERHQMLRAIVQAIYREGMTQKELAAAAKIQANTIRRIESEGPLEMGITKPVEDKLLDFYARWLRTKQKRSMY